MTTREMKVKPRNILIDEKKTDRDETRRKLTRRGRKKHASARGDLRDEG